MLIELFVVDVASGALTKTFDTPDVPVLPTPGEFALAPDGMHAYPSELPGLGVEIDLDVVRAHPFEPELPQRVFYADGSVGDW